MDCLANQDENIREIEDIIDIQKAKGNYDERQVLFNLPSESESMMAANLAKSLESGLTDKPKKKKLKKTRSRLHRSPLHDVISWPSDSDITVLRMKLCITSSELKENIGGLVPGDGLHHPDSSSMVNLATLMKQTQSHSKHSLVEEYLLPLTSWEERRGPQVGALVDKTDADDSSKAKSSTLPTDDQLSILCARCDLKAKRWKIARFFRLYFCPCCSCLYKFERPSNDFTQTRPIELHHRPPSTRNFE